MHVQLKAGTTSKIIQVPIYDSSSTVGAMLTGLVYNTSSLAAYYNREGAAGAATAISLVTATKGTWTSSGFVAVDGTNMPGWYELHVPDAALAAGAKSVAIELKGAANMVPVNILIELTAVDNQDSVRMGMTALPNAAAEAAGGLYTRGTGAGQIAQDANGNIRANLDTIKTQTVTCAAGVTVLANVGTASANTAQTGDAFARLGAPAGASVSADVAAVKSDSAAIKTKTDYLPSATAGAAGGVFIAGSNAATTANITGNITGNLSGSVGSVTGSVGSVTGAVGSVTGAVGSVTTVSDKTGYSLAAGQLFVKKNTQVTITFPMFDSTNHTLKASLAVTAKRSIDGGALTACANSVTEISGGIYSLVLAAADVNGAVITLTFTASGADDQVMTIVTQA